MRAAMVAVRVAPAQAVVDMAPAGAIGVSGPTRAVPDYRPVAAAHTHEHMRAALPDTFYLCASGLGFIGKAHATNGRGSRKRASIGKTHETNGTWV